MHVNTKLAAIVLGIVVPPWTAGCGGQPSTALTEGDATDDHLRDDDVSTVFQAHSVGDTLPGTDPEAFEEARQAFAELETIEDGLGPIFNDTGCGACHTTPVLGGSGDQIERRFGRVQNGVFFAFDTDEDNQGGSLRQLFSVGTYNVGDKVCTIPVEVNPPTATVVDVGRRTQPLFGLGLVDAMPDSFFRELAERQPKSVRGQVNLVPNLLPDPRDPSQRLGKLRVGRFGWKGLIPSLLVFSGDAYLNEMGITTQSCFKGTSVLAFADENFPNNIPPPKGVTAAILRHRRTHILMYRCLPTTPWVRATVDGPRYRTT